MFIFNIIDFKLSVFSDHIKIKANLRVESLKLERLIVAFTIFGVIEHIFHLHSLRIDSGISDTLN